MIITIPSRGRAGNVRTLEFLGHVMVHLVVPYSEVAAYTEAHSGPNVEIHGIKYANIMEKRNWILDKFSARDSVLMLDDDLRFRIRDGHSFRAFLETADMKKMLRALSVNLRQCVHVGVADEFMCQHNPPIQVQNRRYNQVLGYDFTKLRHPHPRFRLTINEEHDMHLQLKALGHPSCVLTDYTKGSKYNASGGCSTWRTPEFEAEQFREFEKLWPGVVTIVPNKNSVSGLATRVAWRKVG